MYAEEKRLLQSCRCLFWHKGGFSPRPSHGDTRQEIIPLCPSSHCWSGRLSMRLGRRSSASSWYGASAPTERTASSTADCFLKNNPPTLVLRWQNSSATYLHLHSCHTRVTAAGWSMTGRLFTPIFQRNVCWEAGVFIKIQGGCTSAVCRHCADGSCSSAVTKSNNSGRPSRLLAPGVFPSCLQLSVCPSASVLHSWFIPLLSVTVTDSRLLVAQTLSKAEEGFSLVAFRILMETLLSNWICWCVF